MSNIITIAEALALPDGAPIIAVAGTFEAVYKQRAGNRSTDGTPYTVQDILFVDNTGKCRVTVWDHPDCTAMKGQHLVLMSIKAANNRFGGVVAKQGKDQNDNPRMEISVSKPGVIQLPSVAAATAPEQPTITPAVTPAPQVIPQAPPASPAVPVTFQKASFDDLAALFGKCYREVATILPQPAGSPDGAYMQALQAAAATLFIQAVKDGHAVGAAGKGNVPF